MKILCQVLDTTQNFNEIGDSFSDFSQILIIDRIELFFFDLLESFFFDTCYVVLSKFYCKTQRQRLVEFAFGDLFDVVFFFLFQIHL